ncbi:MAG: histidinol-phosphatase HisJ family protein [Clostridia bacterium]|nr:histidinol-phosphatase HisJ family protein [Clostridia bacterium]
MKKFLTDIHNHSKFSYDGVSTLSEMLDTALSLGVGFYGVAEHCEYGFCEKARKKLDYSFNEDEYFHTARHLQEDYQGCMNVLVGAEFGYTDDKKAWGRYEDTCKKYAPDFVVNSVHALNGWDYYLQTPFFEEQENGEKILRTKKEVYTEYCQLVRRSLDAPYPYDIVGHFGYVSRYYPQDDRAFSLAEFGDEIDEVLKTVIAKDKILEVNASAHGLAQICLPSEEILRRYYALGGRKISYASDAHQTSSILRSREQIVALLKEIGFTYLTVPCRGEHIKVEL